MAYLSLPLLLQNFVKIAQSVIDLFWLGHLGGNAIAAVGLAFPISSLVGIVVASLPYIGTQVLVSQRVGGDDEFGARKVAFNGLLLALALGVGLGVLSYVAARPLIELMTATRPQSAAVGVLPKAIEYFRILALVTVFAGLSDSIEAALVARGDSRASVHIVLATVGVNAITDPILIFGLGPFPAMGVAGAGLATGLGFFAGFLVGLYFVARGRSGGVMSWDAATFDLGEFRGLIDNGLPPAAQRATRNVADTFTVIIVFAAGGAAGMSAYLIGSRAVLLAMIPAFGLQSATQSVVGQNLGADNPERAHKTAWVGLVFLAGILTPLAVLQWTFAGTITNVLAPEIGPDAYDAAVEFLRLLAYSYPALGAIYAFQGGFNGASRGRVTFLSSIFQYWIVQLPLAVAGAVVFGASVIAVFKAIAVANAATGIALAAYYYYETRSGMFEDAAEQASDDADAAAG
jgi:putative MATE family efflux protein